jgi:hypothetical protein
MTSRLFGVAILVAAASAALPQPPATFDPVGKWSVSTISDEGQPMTVVVEIAGKPGAYTGTAVTSLNRTLPLRDLATMPNGMVAIFDLPQGAIVVKMVRDGTGQFAGAWGEVGQTYALTAERGK